MKADSSRTVSSVGVYSGAVAICIVISATVAAYRGIISGDGLIGLYGSLLGYIFGAAATNGGVKGANSPRE